MYKWYQKAAICFAFMSDFHSEESELQALSDCRWFTRGWTLQELLAPQSTEFYDRNQKFIGTKVSLEEHLSRITGIEPHYLRNPDLVQRACVAERMYWAAQRETTRLEDTAYCLLGLFNVNMPLLYGEGMKAFTRLQQQIVVQSNDETIFAWTSTNRSDNRGMLALSPCEFAGSRWVRRSDVRPKRPASATTNQGLEFAVALFSSRPWVSLLTLSPANTLEVPIGCQLGPGPSSKRLFVRLCRDSPSDWLWRRQGMAKLETVGRIDIFQDLEIIFGGYTKIILASETETLTAISSPSHSGVQLATHQARTGRNVASNLMIVGGTFILLYYMMVYAAFFSDGHHTVTALPVIQWLILTWAWKLSSQQFWLLLLVVLVVFLHVPIGVWIWTVVSMFALSFMHVIKGSHRR